MVDWNSLYETNWNDENMLLMLMLLLNNVVQQVVLKLDITYNVAKQI